jgi:membrane protein YqaA with SNARE-associated domain
MVSTLGYFGVFIVSFVGSATIILPIPSFVLVFALGATMNPWLITLFAAAGNVVGELTGYALGRGGGKLIETKYKDGIEKYRTYFENKKSFFLIVLFAATPLPDDILGIVAGIFRYNIRKFIAASFIGKLIMNGALAWAGFYGMKWVLTIYGG